MNNVPDQLFQVGLRNFGIWKYEPIQLCFLLLALTLSRVNYLLFWVKKKVHCLIVFYNFCLSVGPYTFIYIYTFIKESGLGRFFHRVAMSVCDFGNLFVCPFPMQLFSRPLIGPQATWSDPDLSLVDPQKLFQRFWRKLVLKILKENCFEDFGGK